MLALLAVVVVVAGVVVVSRLDLGSSFGVFEGCEADGALECKSLTLTTQQLTASGERPNYLLLGVTEAEPIADVRIAASNMVSGRCTLDYIDEESLVASQGREFKVLLDCAEGSDDVVGVFDVVYTAGGVEKRSTIRFGGKRKIVESQDGSQGGSQGGGPGFEPGKRNVSSNASGRPKPPVVPIGGGRGGGGGGGGGGGSSGTSDAVAPVVSVSHNPLVPNHTQNVTFNVSASDNVGVASIEVYVNNNLSASCSGVTSCSYIGGPYSANANIEYYAVARDGAGNSARDPSSGFKNFTVSEPPVSSQPTLTVTSPSNGASVSIPFSVSFVVSNWNISVGGRHLHLFVDGVDQGPSYSNGSINVTNATVGQRVISLRLAEADHTFIGVESSVTVNVTVPFVDTSAPSVNVTSPTNNTNVTANVTVSASASDNVGVVGVQFLLDGANLGAEDLSVPYGVVWDASAASVGLHVLSARARDAAGNQRTSSQVHVTVSSPADTQAPAVSVSAPLNNSNVSGNVTISASASDNVGVAGVRFFVDGVAVGNEDVSSPYSVVWNTAAYSNGFHSLTAVARDAAGNSRTSAIIRVDLSNPVPDAQQPSVSLTAPANGATVSGVTSVTATASDNVGVVGVQFLLNGANLGSEDMSAPYSVSWDTSTVVADGVYTLSARARDAAGNSATSASRTVTVNNTVAQFALTVTRAGNGTGTVVSNPAGISCGSDCSESYDSGTSVTLTASSGVGSAFAGWSGACSGTGSCVVSMTQARSVTATFATQSVSNQTTYVYRDSLSSGWSDTSWGTTNNFASTTQTYQGTYSIQSQFSGWGGLQLQSTSQFSTATVNALQFAVYAPVSTTINVRLQPSSSSPTVSRSLVAGWNVVNIQMSELNMGNVLSSFDYFFIQNAQSGSIILYFDEISLGSGPDISPPALNVNVNPSLPAPNQAVTFTATASDPSGINRMVLVVNGVTTVCNGVTTCAYTASSGYANNTNVSYYANATDNSPNRNVASTSGGFRVVSSASSSEWVAVYYTQWSYPNPAPSSVDEPFTHIIVAGSYINSDGTFQLLGDGMVPADLTNLVTAAHNNGLKVIMSTCCSGGSWENSARAHQSTLINNILNTMATYNLDGWDLDWEPIQSTHVSTYRAFVPALRAAMDARFGTNPRKLIVSYAGGDGAVDSLSPANVYNAVDMILPQGYDLVSPSWSACGGAGNDLYVSWHQGPLYSGPYNCPLGNNMVNLEDISLDFVNAGVPKSKIAMSIRFQGSVWVDGVNGPFQTWGSPPIMWNDQGYWAWNQLVTWGGRNPGRNPFQQDAFVHDPATVASWLSYNPTGTTNDYFISVDDAWAAFYKMRYIIDQGYGGAYVWTIQGEWPTTSTAGGMKVRQRDGIIAALSGPSCPANICGGSADTTAPSVNLTAPANNAVVSGTVTLSASASDNVGVVGVQFLLNGANLGSEDLVAPFSYSWDTTGVVDGSYVLSARARDAAGNTATSASRTVTVDNSIPTPSIFTAFDDFNRPNGLLGPNWTQQTPSNAIAVVNNVAGNPTGGPASCVSYNTTLFNVNHSSTVRGSMEYGSRRVWATARASGIGNSRTMYYCIASDIASNSVMGMYLNGVQYTLVAGNTAYNVAVDNVSISVTGSTVRCYRNGVVTLSTISRNITSGNPGFCISNDNNAWADDWFGSDFTGQPLPTDNTPPTASITSPVEGQTVAGNVTIQATASDNVAVYAVQFKVDGNNIGFEDTAPPYSAVLDTTTLANGNHVLIATARDTSDNSGNSTPLNIIVYNPDTIPPTLTLSYQPRPPLPNQAVTFRATANDTNGISRISLSVNGVITTCNGVTTCTYTATYGNNVTVNYWANATDNSPSRNVVRNPASGSFSVLVSNETSDMWISAYYPGWAQQGGWITRYLSEVDWSTFTHMMHFALGMDANANPISEANFNPTLSAAAVAAAHANGKKISVTVWGNSDMTGPLRQTAANNLANYMATYGYDGVDLDFEPIRDPAGFELFVPLLKQAMLARNPNAQLSIAALGVDPTIAHVQQYFDQINIMTYDMSGPWGGWVTWFDSPIYDGGYRFESTGALVPSANGAVDSYVQLGVPIEKLGIGFHGAGYYWFGATAPRQPESVVTGFRPYVLYLEMAGANGGTYNLYDPTILRWDYAAQAAYLSIDDQCNTDDIYADRFVSFDDEKAAYAKVNYVRDKGIGGLIIWDLSTSYLRNAPAGQKDPLHVALKNAFLRIPSTVPPYVNITYSPAAADQTQTITVNAYSYSINDISQLTIYVDGTPVNTCTNSDLCSATVGPFAANSQHTFYAVARDGSPTPLQTTSAARTVTISPTDLTPPIVNFLTPLNGEAIQNTIDINVSATDNAAVSRVEFYVAGQLIDTASCPPYTFSIDTWDYANGPMVMTARAYDLKNNVANTSIIVNVNNILPPDLWFFRDSLTPGFLSNWVGSGGSFSVASGISYAGSNSLQFTATLDGAWGALQPNFTIENPRGYEGLEFYVNGGSASEDLDVSLRFSDGYSGGDGHIQTPVNSWGRYFINMTRANPTGKPITAIVVQTMSGLLHFDEIRLVGKGSSDNIPPNITITSPANNSLVGGNITASATAADNVGVAGVQFYVDGVASGPEDTAAPYQALIDTQNIMNGVHVLAAMARDYVGNTRLAQIFFNVFNLDTRPPTVSIVSFPSVPAAGQPASFRALASDLNGIQRIRIYVQGALAATCSNVASCYYNASGWANGTNVTYYADATDIYNNTRRDPASGSYSFVVGSSSGLWVSAYYPIWLQDTNGAVILPVNQIDFSAITHIMYFSATNSGDQVVSGDSIRPLTTQKMSEITSAAHAAGKKAMLTVWGTPSMQNPANMQPFINNLVDFMVANDFDGIDLDFEAFWPETFAGKYPNFEQFAIALRQRMTAIDPYSQLTVAAPQFTQQIANVHQEFDQINPMTYDMSGAWDLWVAWHNSPISNGGLTFPSTGGPLPSIDLIMDQYIAAGVPANKLGIGTEFYGYYWYQVNAPLQPSVYMQYRDTVPYFEIQTTYNVYDPAILRWDSISNNSYLSIDNSGTANDVFVSFDNERAISAKVNYTRDKGLGGVMIWDLGGTYIPSRPAGQRLPLLTAVKNAIQNMGSPPLPSGNPVVAMSHSPPNPMSSQLVTVNVSASDVDGIASIRIYLDSSLVRTCNGVSVCTYVGGPYSVGNHSYYAVVTDTLGNSVTTSVVVFSVGSSPPADTVAPVVNVSHSPVSPVAGQSVTFTATASDNVGISAIQVFANNNTLRVTCASSPCTYAATYNAGSTVTYYAVANDTSGNVARDPVTGTRSFTVMAEPALPAAGLVLAYGLNEGTGGVVFDQSGNGRDGTLVNGPTWSSSGMFNGSLNFNGAGNYVSIGNLQLTSFTLMFWARPTDYGSGASCRSTFMKKLDYGIEFCGDVGGKIGNGASGWVATISATPPSANAWHHFALSYDGTNLRMYIDGALSGSATGAITPTNNPLNIGTWDGSSEFFNGLFDEVRLYNRSLSLAEIVSDMNTPVGGTPLPVDNTNPTVSVTSPSNGATVVGTIALSASASDNDQVAGVQFLVDGANSGSEDTSAPYSVALDTNTLSNAAHTVTAVARDRSGNTATSSVVSFTVNNPDLTPPTVTVSYSSVMANQPIVISAVATDMNGINSLNLVVQGVVRNGNCVTSGNTRTCTYNATYANNTNVTYYANATDNSPNRNFASASGSFVATTNPPSSNVVMVYYTQWSYPNPAPSSVDEPFTHIILAGSYINSDGTFQLLGDGMAPADLTALVTAAHNNGLKVIMSTCCSGGSWENSARAHQSTLINNILNTMATYNLDGWDLDWEPIQDTHVTTYRAFVPALRAAMDARFGTNPRKLIVSYAGGSGAVPALSPANVYNAVDMILPQGYDLVSPSWSSCGGAGNDMYVSWHQGPLYSGPYNCPLGNNMPNLEDISLDFVNAGVPKSKIAMSIRFQGSVWVDGVNGPFQTWGSPPIMWNDHSYYAWGSDVQWGGRNPGRNPFQQDALVHDPATVTSWLSYNPTGTTNDYFISVDDAWAAFYKMRYIIDQGYGGAYVWTIQGEWPTTSTAGGMKVRQRDGIIAALRGDALPPQS